MPRNTLIGYRGTGKSTVAARLATLLGCGAVDADEVLEKRVGCSIATLIRDRGEPAFRDEESLVLTELLDRCAGVLSTGGGVVLRPDNRALLRGRGRPVVWLTAPAAVVHDRIAADPTTPLRRPSLAAPGGRPAVDLMGEVTAALESREPLYRECADVVIDTSAEPPDAVARRIVEWLADHWPQGPSTEGRMR
jgi:hypothetical protein